jgi:hypothetical protein
MGPIEEDQLIYGTDFILPCVDKDRQAENCSHNSLYIHKRIMQGQSTAISLLAGDWTKFLVSFVPLKEIVLANISYPDGSGRGIQINIDRVGSYSLHPNSTIGEPDYLAEHWGCSKQDAKNLLAFFNTVLSGEDYFKQYSKEVMHKLMKSNKKRNFDMEGGEM